MRPIPFALLCCMGLLAGCGPALRADAPVALATYADAVALRAGTQSIVDAFAAQATRAGATGLGATPVVEVRNTPQLIAYDGAANTLVVPDWQAMPPPMRQVIGTFAGDEAEAERLFSAFFNRFLVAHEAAHWLQARSGRREATLYANERMANRMAVAFWRTQPGGERFLADLERMAMRAAASVPDPTPPGEDAAAYFDANYRRLGPDPLKYGYYQFRFMAEALRERDRLDFAPMVRGASR